MTWWGRRDEGRWLTPHHSPATPGTSGRHRAGAPPVDPQGRKPGKAAPNPPGQHFQNPPQPLKPQPSSCLHLQLLGEGQEKLCPPWLRWLAWLGRRAWRRSCGCSGWRWSWSASGTPPWTRVWICGPASGTGSSPARLLRAG